MRPTAIALFALTLLGGGLGWWLWSSDEDSGPPVVPGTVTEHQEAALPDPASVTEEALDRADLEIPDPEAAVVLDAVADEENVEEDLFPDIGIASVLVVSPDGTPREGVPIVLIQDEMWGMQIMERALTNAEGSVKLLEQPFYGPSGAIRDMKIGFPFPADGASDPFTFTSDAWPEETIRLELPPTGAIEVHLLDPDGEPWLHPVEVQVAPFSLFTRKGKAIQVKELSNLGVTTDDGVARFPHVGIGKRYEIGVSWDPWADWTLLRTAGPTAEEETVRVELQVVSRSPQWRARLLRKDGRPFAAMPVQIMQTSWQVRGGGTTSTRGFVGNYETDAGGNLAFPFPKEVEGEVAALELAIGAHGEPDFGHVEIPIQSTMTGQDQDFGDVIAAGMEALASGTVQDAAGNPLAANIYVYEAHYPPVGRSTDPHFRWAPGSTTEVEDSGAFQSYGVSDAQKLRLEVSADGFVEQEIVVDRGTRGIDVVLQEDLGIAGRLALPAGFPSEDFRVRFVPGPRPEDLTRLSGRRHEVGPEEDGSFRIAGLESDAYGTVLVTHGGSGILLAEVPAVTPTLASASPDARLDPLVVTGLYRYRIEVLGPSGGKGPSYSWTVLEPELPKLRVSSWSFGSAREMVITSPQATVGILADGYRYLEAEVEPGENEVRLERAPLVQFQAPDLPSLPEGMRYTVELDALDGPDLLDQSGSLPEGMAGGIFPVPMAASGRYTVRLGLWDHEHGIDVDVTEGDGPWEFTFVVDEEAAGQSIEVPIPVEAIQQAIAEAQAKAEAQGG